MADLDPALLRQLGLGAEFVAETLQERHGHSVLRLRADGESFVLKLWPDSADAAEIGAYRLLAELGVPTIQLVAATGSALLLEDLDTGPRWRPATEADLESPSRMAGLAEWYRRLHAAGSTPGPWHGELPGEYVHLSVEALRHAGATLDLGREPAWARAAELLDQLLVVARRMPQTLIYHDFHVSNVAVARADPRRAIMIDFHLLRTGTAAGDLRNVTGQLNPVAGQAFLEAYGPVRESESIIDAPLAVIGALCGLDPTLPRIPRWARFLRDEVVDGTLDRKLDAALECG